jgi:hypothetical protein
MAGRKVLLGWMSVLLIAAGFFFVMHTLGRDAPRSGPGPGRPQEPARANPSETSLLPGHSFEEARARGSSTLEAKQCEIFGELRDVAGDAVEGARVFLRSARGSTLEASVSGANFSGLGLDPGTWWVSTEKTGFRVTTTRVALERPGDRKRCDLVLQKSRTVGIDVWSRDGRPFQSVNAELCSALVPVATLLPLPASFRGRKVLGGNPFGVGRFRVSGRASSPASIGTLEVLVEEPVWVSLTLGTSVQGTVELDSSQEVVSFVITEEELLAVRASLYLRVVDEHGLAVPGARIVLDGRGTPPSIQLSGRMGEASFPTLPSGEYWLTVSAPGRAVHKQTMWLASSVRTDLGDIVLTGGVRVFCRLTGEFGTGSSLGEATYVSLGAIDESTGQPRLDLHDRYATKKNPIELLVERGRHVLIVGGSDWLSTAIEFDAQQDGQELLVPVFRPRPLVICLEVTDWEGLMFSVEDDLRHEFISAPVPWSGPFSVALPPGSFVLSVMGANGEALGFKRFEVEASPSVVEFTVETGDAHDRAGGR